MSAQVPLNTCSSEPVRPVHCCHFTRVHARFPVDREQSLSREPAVEISTSCFCVARGSATVDVPLSLGTQAEQREEGREEEEEEKEELEGGQAGWTMREKFRELCPAVSRVHLWQNFKQIRDGDEMLLSVFVSFLFKDPLC